jgi:hypothetical protein
LGGIEGEDQPTADRRRLSGTALHFAEESIDLGA